MLHDILYILNYLNHGLFIRFCYVLGSVLILLANARSGPESLTFFVNRKKRADVPYDFVRFLASEACVSFALCFVTTLGFGGLGGARWQQTHRVCRTTSCMSLLVVVGC